MFAGSLDTVRVTELLELARRTSKSGSFHLWGPATGVVHVVDGEVAFATTRAELGVGAALVRAGHVSADQWQHAVSIDDPVLRAAAIEAAGDPDRMRAFVRQQTEEALWELDRWWGEFSYAPDADPLGGAFRSPIDEILASVAERDSTWRELERSVPSVDLVVHQAPIGPGDDGNLTLSRAQYRLLTAVDGRRSVAELADLLGVGLYAAVELTAGLVLAGLVTLGEQEPGALVPGPDQDELGHDWSNHEPALAGARTPAHAAPVAPPSAAAGRPSTPSQAGTPGLPGVEFVSHHQQPARDLILRLLSAVKELD